uniref:Uncharacterized protein n=1 Tax=Podoviridae sp. ctYKD14 TaxID=2827740 RepID=A0A8S5S521_9CAUD|nr:MAG TPA: hypothetical protein [Podoviridae sp. ctYKD14]
MGVLGRGFILIVRCYLLKLKLIIYLFKSLRAYHIY